MSDSPQYRPVITKALLHARLLEIIRDGATTSLSEVRNLAKLRIPETLEEEKRLDAIESDLLLKNARMGITGTQLLLSRLRKTPDELPTQHKPVPIKIGVEDVYAILNNGRSVSMAEVNDILKRSEEFGLSSYQQEKLRTMLRTAYAKIVRTVNRDVYPVPADLPPSEPIQANDQESEAVPPEFSWVGRKKSKHKER